MDIYKFDAKDICKVDETGVTTVQKSHKEIESAGTKQVVSLVSLDRGVFVTLCEADSAGGQSIPLYFFREPLLDQKGTAQRSG